MNPSHQWRAFLAVTLTLGLAVLACGPSLAVGVPTPPGSPVPVSTAAAGQLESDWATAVASSSPTITVTMTEQELTSYAVLKVQADPTSPITDTQVYLRSGKILLYGQINNSGSNVPAAMILSVVPTAAGAVSVTIDSLNIGPLPVPASLRDSLATNLNALIAQNAGTNSNGFKVTDIVIGDGKMTVTGVVTKSQ